jgi:hypothetical protein
MKNPTYIQMSLGDAIDRLTILSERYSSVKKEHIKNIPILQNLSTNLRFECPELYSQL